MLSLTDTEFNQLVDYVHKNFGINLSKKRTLIEGRLTNYLKERGINSFQEYIDIVTKDKEGKEVNELLNRLTTNHTFFMREEEHFNFLKTTVLPDVAQTNASKKDIRIWSAGCSSGQEAYTIAMTIDEFFGDKKAQWDTTILATDISFDIMAKAQKATYPDSVLDEVPESWRTKYFVNNGDGTVTVCDKIKQQVVFKPFNLMDKMPMAFVQKPFDIIFCRNVMIYFDAPTKDALIDRFYGVTRKGGYFFIGHSETVNKQASKFKYLRPAMFKRED